MKKTVIVCLCVLMCMISSCSSGTPKDAEATAAPAVKTETDAAEQLTDSQIESYMEQYEADLMRHDCYVPQRIWLLGKKELVGIMSLAGVTQITAVPYTSIADFSATLVYENAIITIKDYAGTVYSVSMSAAESSEFIEALTDRVGN